VPLIGKRTAKDLTPADVRGMVRDITAGKTAADIKTRKQGRAIVTGGAGTAARVVSLFGAIMTYAVGEHYRADNPVRGVARAKDNTREIVILPTEYRTIGERIEAAEQSGESWQAVTIARLLMLTGCRRDEIARLHRDAVDVAGSCLRFGDTKTGKSIRPIGSVAVALLRDALARSNGRYVFPSIKRPSGPFSGTPKAFARIMTGAAVMGGTVKITPHGLRHGFASAAEELGLTVPTIGALLGHKGKRGVTQGYIRKTDPALIAAADRVAEHIARAMSGAAGDTDNVVQFRTG
jgi:integrase